MFRLFVRVQCKMRIQTHESGPIHRSFVAKDCAECEIRKVASFLAVSNRFW